VSTTVAELAYTLQSLFTTEAEDAARAAGFIRRTRKLTGAAFAQTLVFGWLDCPTATLDDLAEVAARLGIAIAPQSLDERFTPQAADCLARLLRAALDHAIAAPPTALDVLHRFRGVYALDSSVVSLPAALAASFPGCGGRTPDSGRAAVKAVLRWEVTTGAFDALVLHAGREHDLRAPLAHAPLPPGALLLDDLGYFALARLGHYADSGVYFLSRVLATTAVTDAAGGRGHLADFLRAQPGPRVDVPVRLGAAADLPCRLLAVRVPPAVAARRRQRVQRAARDKGQRVRPQRLALCDWTVLITNAPPALLRLSEALALRRVRWQIELLFKVWKSEGRLDTTRGRAPWRVLCEFYAKLLGQVVQHWAVLVSGGPPLEYSERRAARRVRRLALELMVGLTALAVLARGLHRLREVVRQRCRVRHRGDRPTTFQLLLLNPTHSGFKESEGP
jgi:hypothetical protein